MTLNFRHQPFLGLNQSEDTFSSSKRFDFDDLFVMDGFYDFGRDKIDKGGGGSQSCEQKDVIDLLPADPFGMNMGATFTAWLDIIEMDALNYIWNKAMKVPFDSGNLGTNCGSYSQAFQFDLWLNEKGSVDPTLNGCSSSKSCNTYVCPKLASETCGGTGRCSDQSGGDPHEALTYVLGYLDVKELLSVERACKSLHSAVQNDPLLWRNICIDQPLNERIDDEALLWLTSRAQGNLQSLSMMKCSKVTDDGLKLVLQSNPRLQKLSIPECTRLTIDGIVNNLKELRSSGAPGLKQLRVGGRYDVRQEHFEDLSVLLDMDQHMQRSKSSNPRIYHGGNSSLRYDHIEDSVIDIEMCPRCENPRLIYDCPVDNCYGSSTQRCRACTICIPRCVQCGRCVNDGEYVETFCLDILCLHCCQQQLEVGNASSEQQTDFIYVCG